MKSARDERDSIASSFISERLGQLREEKGMTKSQLAAAAGINKAYVGMIESGVCLRIACGVLRDISIATGASCDWLLGVTDERSDAEGHDVHRSRYDKAQLALMKSLRESLEEIDDILCRALEGEKDAMRLRAAIKDAVFYMADTLLDMDELMGMQ